MDVAGFALTQNLQFLGASNSWKTCANIPNGGLDPCGAFLKNKVYRFGGYHDSKYLLTTYEYDIQADTWSQKADMKSTGSSAAATEYNGKAYVVGGYGFDGRISYQQVYDPDTNTWTSLAGRANHDGLYATIGNKLYSIGTHTTTSTNLLYEYDPGTNTWTSKTPLPDAAVRHTGDVINGKLYVIYSTYPKTKLMEYDPVLNSWTEKATPPLTSGLAMVGTAVEFNGLLFYFENHNIYVYDPKKNEWTVNKSRPLNTIEDCVISTGAQIYTFGGRDKNSTSTNLAYAYTPQQSIKGLEALLGYLASK